MPDVVNGAVITVIDAEKLAVVTRPVAAVAVVPEVETVVRSERFSGVIGADVVDPSLVETSRIAKSCSSIAQLIVPGVTLNEAVAP
jgi:hypothetical protein